MGGACTVVGLWVLLAMVASPSWEESRWYKALCRLATILTVAVSTATVIQVRSPGEPFVLPPIEGQ